MCRWSPLLVALAIFLIGATANAGTPLHLEAVEDPHSTLSVAEVAAQSGWREVTDPVPSFGFTLSRYWLRFPAPRIPGLKSGESYLIGIDLGTLDLEAARLGMIQADKLSALGRMAGGIAHEINNPLLIIHGRVEQARRLLESKAEPPGSVDRERMSDALGSIEATSFRISKIVQAMKKLSRDSRRDPMEETELDALIGDALTLVAERFRAAGVNIEAPPPTGLCVRCRPPEIVQVLVNLLQNALDAVAAAPEKKVTVVARAEDAARAELVVTDSGSGIPPELRARILEPFFTTKPAGQGTGLGLSISRTIVEAHGGKLRFDNEAEGGTRVTFTLPRLTKGMAMLLVTRRCTKSKAVPFAGGSSLAWRSPWPSPRS